MVHHSHWLSISSMISHVVVSHTVSNWFSSGHKYFPLLPSQPLGTEQLPGCDVVYYQSLLLKTKVLLHKSCWFYLCQQLHTGIWSTRVIFEETNEQQQLYGKSHLSLSVANCCIWCVSLIYIMEMFNFVELFFIHTVQFGNVEFLHPLFSAILMIMCRHICLCCLKDV